MEEVGLARMLCGSGKFSMSLALYQGSERILSTPMAQTPVGFGETDRGTGLICVPITVLLSLRPNQGGLSPFHMFD